MSTKVRRIMFTPNEEVLSAVEALEGKGKTKSDVINRAVMTEKAIREAAAEGGAVYIERANGDRERIVLVG